MEPLLEFEDECIEEEEQNVSTQFLQVQKTQNFRNCVIETEIGATTCNWTKKLS